MDRILGLPLHPLVVHAAVVLVPLAALAALLLVAVPRLRPGYGWLGVGVAAVAAASAITARFSGEWLMDDLGLRGSRTIATHMAWGLWAPWPALLLAIVLPLFLWAGRRGTASGGRGAVVATGALTVVAAVASLVLIGLTGHAGALAVWGSV